MVPPLVDSAVLATTQPATPAAVASRSEVGEEGQVTRRSFFAALVPILGTTVPVQGTPAFISNEQGGFILTGRFDTAGEDPRHAYFALGQGLTLMIDPERLPACASGAQSLIGTDATISLTPA